MLRVKGGFFIRQTEQVFWLGNDDQCVDNFFAAPSCRPRLDAPLDALELESGLGHGATVGQPSSRALGRLIGGSCTCPACRAAHTCRDKAHVCARPGDLQSFNAFFRKQQQHANRTPVRQHSRPSVTLMPQLNAFLRLGCCNACASRVGNARINTIEFLFDHVVSPALPACPATPNTVMRGFSPPCPGH